MTGDACTQIMLSVYLPVLRLYTHIRAFHEPKQANTMKKGKRANTQRHGCMQTHLDGLICDSVVELEGEGLQNIQGSGCGDKNARVRLV